MPQLTKDQADALADALLDASRAVDDFRWEHRRQLSTTDKDALEELRRRLAGQCEDMTAKAISLEIDDIAGVVARIGGVTERACQAVRHMADAGRVLKIAGAVVALGTAVAGGNMSGVGSAIQDIAGQLQLSAG